MVRQLVLALIFFTRAACLDQEEQEDAMWERPEDPLAPLGEDERPATQGSHTTIQQASPSEPDEEEDEGEESSSPPSGAAWNDDAF